MEVKSEAPRFVPKKMPRPAPPPPPPPPPKNAAYEVELAKILAINKSEDCRIKSVWHTPEDNRRNNVKHADVVAGVTDVKILKVTNNLRENASCSDVTINKMFSRRAKRRLLALSLAVLCFLTGVACVLLVRHLTKRHQRDDSQRSIYGVRPPVPPLPFTYDASERRSNARLAPSLNDLFISVKTTKKYHHPRLVILLETWASLVARQTYFFTDLPDEEMSSRIPPGHLVVTQCSDSHSRTALACKMAAEFDRFLKSHKRWWCHFDDDNYVHVARLGDLLAAHDPSKPVYLGKPSTAKPLEIFDIKAPQNTSHFWFATGGAGFCISRTMALKMAPFAANGKFVETGNQFWFPDDVTLGYIIEHLLGERLTVVPEFHSHLEPMKRLTADRLDSQITFSYITYNGVSNSLDLPGPFPVDADPTRFYSLHCRLYSAPFCPDEEPG